MMILHKMTIKWLLLHSRIGFKDYDFEYENDHWRRRWWEERRPSPGASKSSSSAPRTRRWPSTYYVITTTRMMVTFGKKRSKLQFDSFIPCSERIVRAVTDMVLLFPEVSSIFFQAQVQGTNYSRGNLRSRAILLYLQASPLSPRQQLTLRLSAGCSFWGSNLSSIWSWSCSCC